MFEKPLVIATMSLLTIATLIGLGDEPAAKEGVTLMGMLNEWIYPESQFHGAETSDAAVSNIGAIKSKAILSTPDSVEKVMNFYCKKLNVNIDGKNIGEKQGERVTMDRSILIQDASKGRSTKLYVIAINRAKSSMTLVVSRSDQDDTTQIAWSDYRQLHP
jgi:hypothetical protein